MNNKEAIEELRALDTVIKGSRPAKAIRKAISALEQEKEPAPVRGEIVLCKDCRGDFRMRISDGKGRAFDGTGNTYEWEEMIPTGQVIDLDSVLEKAKEMI